MQHPPSQLVLNYRAGRKWRETGNGSLLNEAAGTDCDLRGRIYKEFGLVASWMGLEPEPSDIKPTCQ